jgi:transcriptional regulator with XRE-family HTH domain
MGGMTTKKNPLGPTGDTVRQNIKRAREARGLSYAALSRMLAEAGRPIPTLGLSRIEEGQRRVDADDLVALAVALRVNPSALLLPPTVEGDADLTGRGTVPAVDAWDWADGNRPLVNPRDDDGTAGLDFLLHARPVGRRDPAQWRAADVQRAYRSGKLVIPEKTPDDHEDGD